MELKSESAISESMDPLRGLIQEEALAPVSRPGSSGGGSSTRRVGRPALHRKSRRFQPLKYKKFQNKFLKRSPNSEFRNGGAHLDTAPRQGRAGLFVS
jgi:hypothetical protein